MKKTTFTRFSSARVFTLALVCVALCATRVEAQVTTVEVWGVASEEQDVRDIALDGSDVYLSGQKDKGAGFDGRGYFCKHDTGGCSSVPTENGTFVAVTAGGVEKYSDAWEMDIDGTTLFIASKSKKGSSPAGCLPSGGATDAWIQSFDLADLTALLNCDNPNLSGNDEGLAVKIIGGDVYWGGTMKSTMTSNQSAVFHKQQSNLAHSPRLGFEFTGNKLSELFDITAGGGLIFVTGRAETNFVTGVCGSVAGAVCSGGKGKKTDAWVAAFDENFNLVWLWQDASRGKSAGQGIEYVDDGLGNQGLVLVGHYAEDQPCPSYDGVPGSGSELYTQGYVTWLPLTGGIFDEATAGPPTPLLYGDPCVGDTFSDVAVNGTDIYAVGAVLGPEADCNGGHCPSNGFEDAVLVEYTLYPAAVASLTQVTDRIYEGTAAGGDDSDAFLTVEHDGANMLYMGGFTQSTDFGKGMDYFVGGPTGIMDSMLVTLAY